MGFMIFFYFIFGLVIFFVVASCEIRRGEKLEKIENEKNYQKIQ
jgi:hypothetical protein